MAAVPWKPFLTYGLRNFRDPNVFWYAPKHVAPPPSSLTVERKNGPLAVRMTLPPAGFAIYQAAPGLNRLGPRPPPDLKPWQPPGAHR